MPTPMFKTLIDFTLQATISYGCILLMIYLCNKGAGVKKPLFPGMLKKHSCLFGKKL